MSRIERKWQPSLSPGDEGCLLSAGSDGEVIKLVFSSPNHYPSSPQPSALTSPTTTPSHQPCTHYIAVFCSLCTTTILHPSPNTQYPHLQPSDHRPPHSNPHLVTPPSQSCHTQGLVILWYYTEPVHTILYSSRYPQ